METIVYTPIGVIRSPFQEKPGIPRQSAGAQNITGRIEIFEPYAEGLQDVEGFSHLVVLFHLHLIESAPLLANPPWDDKPHGVFATRSPYRPNQIGLSVVRLERREGAILHIRGVDMADGSPVLDIKPYIPELNPAGEIKLGWFEGKVHFMNQSKSGDG